MKNTWTPELEFCEQNLDLLLTYLGRRWRGTNQQVFQVIMCQALDHNRYFTEQLFLCFDNFKGNKRDFILMMQGQQVL